MIISIASGKGGTGKTMVATSLAASIKNDYEVQLLDADVEEPNSHIFLKPTINNIHYVSIMTPLINEERCNHCGKCAEICAFKAVVTIKDTVLTFPELCHGCGACSYLCPRQAISETPNQIGIIETGAAGNISFVQGKLDIGQTMPTPVVRKVKEHIDQKKIAIIDAAPGTSCPVIAAIKDSDFCLLVTEPTPFGLNDLKLAVETVTQLSVPCGLVLNRSGIGYSNVEEYCHQENIPILLTIPLSLNIARFYSEGIMLVEGLPEYQEKFKQAFSRIQEIASERNSRT
ncbi:MAG: ATP-binding protein [Dehalococcoidales bacterium]|nr:ATP-binding protein [Dehalococcoidales bacterium]